MEEHGLIYDVKLSSVGPGKMTCRNSTVDPGNMGLAMKLHYLRGVYYFGTAAFEGLSTMEIKAPMFSWLSEYPATCGRFRRTESGQAYVKCNDCGVRFVEARCRKSLDEWLEPEDLAARESRLCTDHCIGPDLAFSPLVFVQLTKFKCGAVAVGLSWAHVLGDPFSAAEYMNSLGRVIAGRPIRSSHTTTNLTNSNGHPRILKEPVSVKRVDRVGDHWTYAAKTNMHAFSFDISPMQLSHLRTKLNTDGATTYSFDAISASIWKCIAKTRADGLEPRIVTICKKGEQNCQTVGTVKASFPIAAASLSELAALIKNEAVDETYAIEEAMAREGGLADFIVYGANLTFVNLEEAGFYNFEYRGEKPVRVSYQVDGVGESGAVLVLPGMKLCGGEKGDGWSVVTIMPESEIVGLKLELAKEGLGE